VPEDGTALNNLAWVLALQGGQARLEEARGLAERAYFVAPSAGTADTLGWVLAQPGYAGGDPRLAVTLLRLAATGNTDRGIAYRLAFALRAVGERPEAARILVPVLAGSTAFAERADAEALQRDLAQ